MLDTPDKRLYFSCRNNGFCLMTAVKAHARLLGSVLPTLDTTDAIPADLQLLWHFPAEGHVKLAYIAKLLTP